MKIGIIKETKVPEDNRVVLTPKQIVLLRNKYPSCEFIVQSSNIRAFSDEEYSSLGIQVKDKIDDCDVLFGVKEVDINYLIPNKHYFFFGHIGKMQPYNRDLAKKMIDLKITFTDYEYLVGEDGIRLCAFGWWAGVVGVYNTLRAFGIRNKLFELPKPDRKFTLADMLAEARKHQYPSLKIVITGKGRVSQGAQYFLNNISFNEVSPSKYLSIDIAGEEPIYTVLNLPELVKHKDKENFFERGDFERNPSNYKSAFDPYAYTTDIFISCHFWRPDEPVYLSKELMQNKNCRIKIVGDVTCDINGSIECTIRPSTHDKPFYDYNPLTGLEENAFSSDTNITIMAVDTLPNALALDTSEYFGEALINNVLENLTPNKCNEGSIKRATILEKGVLTKSFRYLSNYINNR